MKILNKIKLIFLLVLIPLLFLTLTLYATRPKVFASHSRVDLGTADSFAVLAGSAVTDTGTTTIIGSVGLSPTAGTGITGLLTTEVTGTIYAVDSSGPAGSAGNNPSLLTTAKNDLTTAYNDAAGRTTTATVATNLGGTTLTDGTYVAASGTFEITGGQTLTLDGEGNANAVFIFKMGTTLVTGSSSSVVLINGAQACNVYWQVGSSATLGTSTSLIGNVLALTSITDDGSSTVNGRLLARNAAVTLNNTTITKSTCAAGTAGGAALASSSSSSSDGGSCPTLNNVSPIIIESRRIDADSIFISWGPYSGTDTFIVQYGLENGNWSYSTNVTGFSTTLNALPPNQPIWVRVAARNSCSVGTYGAAVLVGGGSGGLSGNSLIPRLPNTGIGPDEKNIPWGIVAVFPLSIVIFYLARRAYKFSSK